MLHLLLFLIYLVMLMLQIGNDNRLLLSSVESRRFLVNLAALTGTLCIPGMDQIPLFI